MKIIYNYKHKENSAFTQWKWTFHNKSNSIDRVENESLQRTHCSTTLNTIENILLWRI